MLRVQVTFVMVAAAEAWTMIDISVMRGLVTFHSLNDHLQARLNLSILSIYEPSRSLGLRTPCTLGGVEMRRNRQNRWGRAEHDFSSAP
jgi:hypothetical protein